MTLDEAFKNFSEETKMRRTSSPAYRAYDIKWLKGLKAWGNEESRKLGFWIPQFMIDDANADDWEVFKD